MGNFVIGVEGEVGSGKTTMCKELTKLLPNTVFIDGGMIYKGIMLALRKTKLTPLDYIKYAGSIKKLLNGDVDVSDLNSFDLMKRLNVEFKMENNISEIYIGGEKVNESEVQSSSTSMDVSKYASKIDNKSLYEFARSIIYEYGEKQGNNIIVAGRDLIHIYPEMDAHIFVTCDIDERVNRRFKQYDGKVSKDELKEKMLERDRLHEEAGFSDKYEKSIILDVTDCKSVKESCDKFIKTINEKTDLSL